MQPNKPTISCAKNSNGCRLRWADAAFGVVCGSGALPLPSSPRQHSSPSCSAFATSCVPKLANSYEYELPTRHLLVPPSLNLHQHPSSPNLILPVLLLTHSLGAAGNWLAIRTMLSIGDDQLGVSRQVWLLPRLQVLAVNAERHLFQRT